MEKIDKSKVSIDTYFDKNDYINGILKFDSVLKMFEKVAIKHANVIGVGFDEMIKNNLLWVTMRIKYKIIREPLPNEKITISTFATNKTIVEFDRDFKIESNGQTILIGTSKWCLIDDKKRKISKLDNLDNFDNIILPSLFDEKFLKTQTFETSNLQPVLIYTIQNKDIDKNGHTNNAVYAKILNNFIKNKNYSFFQINFLKETLHNEKIKIFEQTQNDITTVLGLTENNQISFSAEIK